MACRNDREYYRAHRARADFLRIDSEIGLTYSGMALGTSDAEKKSRATHFARQAYDAVEVRRLNVGLTDEEKDTLNFNMARLKGELRRLGQSF
jgi:hypothetical protein